MASFKITDLTELASGSVADTDVLEIVDLDADESKKVTIASLKTVFAGGGVSEGDSYTGGTANGIMFNDGNTFATSGNLTFDSQTLVHTLSNGQTADAFQINSYGNTGGDLFGIESDGLIRSQIATSNTIGQVHYNFPNAYSITSLITLTSNKYSAFFGYYTGVKHQGLYIGTNSTGGGFIQNIDGASAYRFSIQPYGAELTIGRTAGMPNTYKLEVNGGSYFKDNLSIGASSIDASAKLQIDSTTQGALLPRMTTTQRDAIASPATGLLIFNTTTKKLDYYSGTAWGQV